MDTAIIGILGGMGPQATVDFYGKLTSHVRATHDQDHPQVLIWSNPKIPDRTEFLTGEGEDPTPALREGTELLKKAGAQVLAVPCNTAHVFMEDVCREVGMPFVSMIDAVVDEVVERVGEAGTVGVVATTGTLATGLYRRALEERGLTVLEPDEETQAASVMPAITLVKAGECGPPARDKVARAAATLAAAGAEVIIAGCTETPLILDHDNSPVPVVDSTDVLARRVLTEVGVPLA